MVFAAAVAVLLANLAAFLVYGFDKRQAQGHGWRVAEGTLIFWAIAGGIGAWLGCETFRHKTRKQPFRGYLIAAICLHMIVLFGMLAFLPD